MNYAKSRGSTGNLRRHLKSFHPEKWSKESKIGPIDYFLSDNKYLVSLGVFLLLYLYIFITKFCCQPYTPKNFREKLIHWIVCDDQPFTVVEKLIYDIFSKCSIRK